MDYLAKKAAWLSSPSVSAEMKDEIGKADDATWKEMFSSDLHFGTAGMRALMGPGSARLNALTVRRATIGVAKFLLGRYPKEARERGVAISFDNRHHSLEFRDVAAKVLREHGIKVYTFHEPHPTPELSYAVRHLHCVGGLMITASHNPKQYNGYKFYDEKGCQGVYETIDGLIDIIEKLPDELSVTYEPVAETEKGALVYLDEDERFDQEYLAKELSTSYYFHYFRGERKTKIVFSPECGCDSKVGPALLRMAGYEVTTVPGQDFFDPDFSGTKNPNPETPEAYEGAEKTLKELQAQGKKYALIEVTDPDADRCGIAFVNRNGEIQRFTGNQTGALLIDFVLSTRKKRNELPEDGVVCDTFVTGGQGEKVASLYGVKVRTTATGFKYIGNMADQIESAGETFLFGYEESYGYLLADFVRDKDSLQSILAIADMTEYYLRQGKTLDVAYEELCARTGEYYDTQYNVYFQGPSALSQMNEQLEKLRKETRKTIGPKTVKTVTDYEKRTVLNVESGTLLPLTAPDIDVSNCIRFDFKEGGFIAIRPSGTEPKVKFYVEVVRRPLSLAKKEADQIDLDLEKSMGLK